jgi:hypothetical protein
MICDRLQVMNSESLPCATLSFGCERSGRRIPKRIRVAAVERSLWRRSEQWISVGGSSSDQGRVRV